MKSEIATFFEAFPNGVVFGNTNNGAGYDLVLLGQRRADQDRRRRDRRRGSSDPAVRAGRAVAARDRHVSRRSICSRPTPAGDRTCEPWLSDAQINRDRNLRLQYLAGLGLNLYQSDAIYADMLKHATRFPDELFIGSPATIQALRAGIARQQGR